MSWLRQGFSFSSADKPINYYFVLLFFTMELRQYLIDTFHFNDRANRTMIAKIKTLPQPEEPVRFVSHLINSQNKWMARILQYPNAPQMDWWEPVYPLDMLESEWEISLLHWITFLEEKEEDQLFEEAFFIGKDGSRWSAPLKDIALQLNYHSFHHRAQIQVMIRHQGIVPDFIDYISSVYKKY
jgi:uncharacterized damage-inducible protein DinB